MVRAQDINAKVESLLALGNLQGFGDVYPYQLSGGMRRRVALLMTLACDPSILLLDEPFGALDTHTKTLLHRELIDIWRKMGQTIVLVTHNLDEAVTLSDRSWCCRQRRVTSFSTIEWKFRTRAMSSLCARQKHLLVTSRRSGEFSVSSSSKARSSANARAG